MEVWAMPENQLLQRTEQALISASNDPVRFEDVNEDGFLGLSIDQYCPVNGFYNTKIDPYYWLRNPVKICFEPLTDSDLSRQSREDRERLGSDPNQLPVGLWLTLPPAN